MYQLQVSFGSVKTDAIYDSASIANVIKKSKNKKNRENTGRFRIDYVSTYVVI